MDHTIEWRACDDAGSLVNSVLELKRELTKACFSKYGAARIVDFEVLASKKMCDFIMLAGGHTKPGGEVEDLPWMRCVAQFVDFKLYKFKHIDDDTIRVLTRFDVSDDYPKQWYGNVDVVH